MAPIEYIPRTREMYQDYPPYRWVVSEDVPWTPLARPLSSCRVALATSGGVHLADQEPFHTKDDTSYREISKDAAITELRISHFGYRTQDAQRDPNCVFPMERMRELAADGVIGELADPAYSFMGGIYSARRVRAELASPLAELLVARGVDVLFLVPA